MCGAGVMRLILVRHGETAHHRAGLRVGRADVPLNERGLAQARALATSFARPPVAIYASPLQRARETAAAIATATGIDVQVVPELVEMDVGEMARLSKAELRLRYPEFAAQWRSEGAADARVPGGETLREVQERAWRAVEQIQVAHPAGEVVAVTHDFVIRTIVCRALDLPLARLRRLRQGLAAKTVIELRKEGPALLQLNDNAHLVAAALGDDTAG